MPADSHTPGAISVNDPGPGSGATSGRSPVTVAVTGYMVSRLPDTSPDQETWGIRVEATGHGRWAARTRGYALSRDGSWDYEPQPSSRTDKWLDEHRWDSSEEAIEAALAAEPLIIVNGLTPEDVRQRQIARHGMENQR